MGKNNRVDRKGTGLFLAKSGNSADGEAREQSHEDSWELGQLPDSQSQTEKIPNEEEAAADLDNDAAEKAENPVVIYLRDLGAVPLLSREQEVKLAQKIEEGEAQIAREVLSSPLALHASLDLAKKIAAGQISILDVVDDMKEKSPGDAPAKLTAQEKIFKARFCAQMRQL